MPVVFYLLSSRRTLHKTAPAKTVDNKVMHVARAFLHQAEFEAAVAKAARRLSPHVVSVVPTVGDDWSGDAAVFFTVVLKDAAVKPDNLLRVTNEVRNTIESDLAPREEWGVLPYSVSAANRSKLKSRRTRRNDGSCRRSSYSRSRHC